MEFIFEFILELFLEGGIEISSNKKISKWIRYPIIFLIILFFLIVIFGLLFLGITFFKKETLAGLLFIVTSIILLIGSVIKFRQVYVKKK